MVLKNIESILSKENLRLHSCWESNVIKITCTKWFTMPLSKSPPLRWVSPAVAFTSNTPPSILRARLHDTRSELKPVWNLKPLWNVVPFTWQFTWRFHCRNFPNNSKTLLHMCNWHLLINANLMQNGYCAIGCFLNNSSKTHAHYLVTLMILCNFISLRAFFVYMKNSLRFEISLRSIWPKWNLHRSEFHSARSHVNADNEITSHWSEILS